MNTTSIILPPPTLEHNNRVKSGSSETDTQLSASDRQIDQRQYHSATSFDIINHPRKSFTQKVQPLKGLYYKNRVHFINWMRKECTKLQLSVQTFAGAVALMDRYFRQTVFDCKDFACLAVCMLIISSKINETKVLYTSIMAVKSKIDINKMQETELAVMVKFKFKINAYNYARIVHQYMIRWDEIISQSDINGRVIPFFKPQKKSYLSVQQLMYVCQQQLKHNKQLLSSTLKLIFQLVLSKNYQIDLTSYIDKVFSSEQTILAQAQYQYVFEYISQDSYEYPQYIAKVRQDISNWLQQFSKMKPSYENKYDDHVLSSTHYADFLGLLF